MKTTLISEEDAEEYTQSLGQVLTGGWRQYQLADKMGVPKALGLTLREWVEQRLGGYMRLNIPDRQDAVKKLADEGLSQQKIADVLGVSKKTVWNDEKSPPQADGIEENGEKSPMDEQAKRKREEKKRQENQRETMIRLAEQAYNSTVAWSVESFCKSVNESLSDDKFKSDFLSRVRINPANLNDIQKGAKVFARLLTKLTK